MAAVPDAEKKAVLDLSKEEKIRILVDFKSIQKGTGAPEASFQLMKGIREKYGFNGRFELVPSYPKPLRNKFNSKEEEQREEAEGVVKYTAEARNRLEKVRKEDGNAEIMEIDEGTTLESLESCKFGFTGAYDWGSAVADEPFNESYDNGLNCKCFITLSTQGWKIHQDNSEHERMGPNVKVSGKARYDVSVHLPRKDVLLLQEEEIETYQKSKQALLSEDKTLKVVLYKLDQEKNYLVNQREYILKALDKYAREMGQEIIVTEVTGVGKLGMKAKGVKIEGVYEHLKIEPLEPNLEAAEYHNLLAGSHAVFCEGQSTASQAMLYGTAAFHMPLDNQGFNIHQSNFEISKKGERLKLTAEEETYTAGMNDLCLKMRKKYTFEAKPIEKIENKQKREKGAESLCYSFISKGLSLEGQQHSLSIANKIREDKKLDMLTQCVAHIPRELLQAPIASPQPMLPAYRRATNYQSATQSSRQRNAETEKKSAEFLKEKEKKEAQETLGSTRPKWRS